MEIQFLAGTWAAQKGLWLRCVERYLQLKVRKDKGKRKGTDPVAVGFSWVTDPVASK